MLYYIFRWLEGFGISGSHLWTYISFRSILAFVAAMLLTAWLGEHFIKYMHRNHIYEKQRSAQDDPFGVEKKGVPSMGGLIIIAATLIPCLMLCKLRNVYIILMIVTTVWLGILGFLDDYIKIFRGNKDGLKGKFKIVGQLSIGLIVGLTLHFSPEAKICENVTVERQGQSVVVIDKSAPVKSTQTTIPFVKAHNLSYTDIMGFLGDKWKYAGGWALFVIMTIIVVTSVSNGANLNDGMDGMAAGNSAIIGVALCILAYVSAHIEYASYLDIMYIPQAEELVVFISGFIGALIGFLWYNAYPAQVFMGDTGSLTIGGIIGVLAVIIHKELLVPLLCCIFFIESLSVILQTQCFKFFKRKGRRVRLFRAAPIHDNFRKLDSQLDPTSTYILRGWPKRQAHESKITVRFWVVTLIFAALTIITLKIR